MNFFSYLFSPETSRTIWLYIGITILSYFTACLSQRIRYIVTATGESKIIKFNYFWFIITFIILWFFYVFNKTGADLETYLQIFEATTWESLFNIQIEIGYRFLNLIIMQLTSNPYFAIGIIKTIIMLLLFSFLFYLKDKIHMGIAIFAYVVLFYFQSFNLIRITLAAMICVLGIRYLIQKKNFRCILTFIIATTIHYSAIVSLFTLLVYFLYTSIRVNEKTKIILLVISMGIILLFGKAVIIFFINRIWFFDKYINYTQLLSKEGTGLVQYLYYAPIFLILFYVRKRYRKIELLDVCMIWTCIGFCIAILGYTFGIFTRLAIYFSVSYILLIPYFVQQVKLEKFTEENLIMEAKKSSFYMEYNLITVFVILYFIIRFISYISGSLLPDGIQNFIFIWQ